MRPNNNYDMKTTVRQDMKNASSMLMKSLLLLMVGGAMCGTWGVV